jgi:hypothetical protein
VRVRVSERVRERERERGREEEEEREREKWERGRERRGGGARMEQGERGWRRERQAPGCVPPANQPDSLRVCTSVCAYHHCVHSLTLSLSYGVYVPVNQTHCVYVRLTACVSLLG